MDIKYVYRCRNRVHGIEKKLDNQEKIELILIPCILYVSGYSHFYFNWYDITHIYRPIGATNLKSVKKGPYVQNTFQGYKHW